eukprot:g12127.t1
MDFILPQDYTFYNSTVVKFLGTGGTRAWGSQLFLYENPPPMPLRKQDIAEWQTLEYVSGWGVVQGFNLTELAKARVTYPVLPNLVNADVHVGFELQYVLVNLADSLILSGPRGFLLDCAPPAVPSPQAATYRCNPCIDIVRSRVFFAQDAAAGEGGFDLAPGSSSSAGLVTDPILALFGQVLTSNTDPRTGKCYDPNEMFTTEEALEENFGQFAYYLNMSVKGLILSEEQIGDVTLLERAVPFSFFLKMRTASDTRSALQIREDNMRALDPNDPSTYNGDWSFRIHDGDNITVDAKFEVPNPNFVTGLPIEAPTLRMQFPEYNVREAGEWDRWKSTVTITLSTRNLIYFIDEASRFKAILMVLPQMFEHNIREPSEFKSLNRKFPIAMNTDWRQYRASKRYVVVLIEAVGIEELTLEIDSYSWQFPVKVPSRSWPIDTTFQLILCRNYNPCGWPMEEKDYVVLFPIYGPSREEYLRLIETDTTVYYRGGAKRSKSEGFGVVLWGQLVWAAVALLGAGFCRISGGGA